MLLHNPITFVYLLGFAHLLAGVFGSPVHSEAESAELARLREERDGWMASKWHDERTQKRNRWLQRHSTNPQEAMADWHAMAAAAKQTVEHLFSAIDRYMSNVDRMVLPMLESYKAQYQGNSPNTDPRAPKRSRTTWEGHLLVEKSNEEWKLALNRGGRLEIKQIQDFALPLGSQIFTLRDMVKAAGSTPEADEILKRLSIVRQGLRVLDGYWRPLPEEFKDEGEVDQWIKRAGWREAQIRCMKKDFRETAVHELPSCPAQWHLVPGAGSPR